MCSVNGVGSSLGMAIVDVDMPDRAPKRPWADVEGMLPLQGQGQAAPQSSGAAAGDKAITRTKIAQWLKRIWRNSDEAGAYDFGCWTDGPAISSSLMSSGCGGTGGEMNKYRKRSVSLSICLSTLCVVLTVIAVRDASWQVSFLQYSGNAGMGTGIGWMLCNACCVRDTFSYGGESWEIDLDYFFSLERLCKARAEPRQGTCEWRDAVDTTHRHGDVTRECEGCCWGEVGASCTRRGWVYCRSGCYGYGKRWK